MEAVEKEEMEKGKVGKCFKWRRGEDKYKRFIEEKY